MYKNFIPQLDIVTYQKIETSCKLSFHSRHKKVCRSKLLPMGLFEPCKNMVKQHHNARNLK